MTPSNPPTLLALDVSKRRIGFAVNHGALVFGRGSHQRTRLSADLKRVQKLAQHEGAQGLVIGLPRDTLGRRTPETDRVLGFGRELERLGFAVQYRDERYSTARARSAGAADHDEGAAVQILQLHLEWRAAQEQKEGSWPAG